MFDHLEFLCWKSYKSSNEKTVSTFEFQRKTLHLSKIFNVVWIFPVRIFPTPLYGTCPEIGQLRWPPVANNKITLTWQENRHQLWRRSLLWRWWQKRQLFSFWLYSILFQISRKFEAKYRPEHVELSRGLCLPCRKKKPDDRLASYRLCRSHAANPCYDWESLGSLLSIRKTTVVAL